MSRCSDDACDDLATAEGRKEDTDAWKPLCDRCASHLHAWGWDVRSL